MIFLDLAPWASFTAFNIRITSAMFTVPQLSATSLRFFKDDVRSPATVNP